MPKFQQYLLSFLIQVQKMAEISIEHTKTQIDGGWRAMKS